MYRKSLISFGIALICILILARVFYLIFIKRNKIREKSHAARTMIILGSGGHTAEMLRIIKHLDLKNYSPRVYIHAQTDKLSAKKEMTDNNSMIIVPWDSLTEELKNIPNEIGIHLTSIINTLHTSDERLTSEKWLRESKIRTEACLDRTWELLNSGYWKDVPIEYRYCYTLCVIVKAALLELQCGIKAESSSNEEERKITLRDIINQIDKGILLGAPLSSMPDLLTAIAAKLNSYCAEETSTITSEEIPIGCDKISDTILPGFSEIARYEIPSMESFYRDIFMPKCPAILTGCMKHWKALTLWKNSDYLHKIAGSRTVPIEIGSRYTEEDWSQRLVNFSEFLQKYVITNNSKIGYLAQHQLFEQIPELKEDFAIPEYCNFSDNQESDIESPDVNAWFGPDNTVSPLHYDAKNNLLSQVFGYKKIILYHPDEAENLYPYKTRLLDNTAQVDPINPDYDKWPNFRKVKGFMCYLKPGEMLYIPPKWWHHIRKEGSRQNISLLT